MLSWWPWWVAHSWQVIPSGAFLHLAHHLYRTPFTRKPVIVQTFTLPSVTSTPLPAGYLDGLVLRKDLLRQLQEGFTTQQEADVWMTKWSLLKNGPTPPLPSGLPPASPLTAWMSPTPSATQASGNSVTLNGRNTGGRGGKRPATVKFNRI